MLRAACAYAVMDMLAGYDAKNAKAIARLVAAGTQLSVLPEDHQGAAHGARAGARRGGREKRAVQEAPENWRAFRAEQHRWFSIADARTEMSVYALTAAQ